MIEVITPNYYSKYFYCKHCGERKRKNPRLKNNQSYCGSKICQRARRNQWEREKLKKDPLYYAHRKEQLPGTFLLLNRYRTGLKPSEELPSNSYYPMSIPHIKFRFENILSLLNFFAMLEGIDTTDNPRRWYHFSLSGGSVYMWY